MSMSLNEAVAATFEADDNIRRADTAELAKMTDRIFRDTPPQVREWIRKEFERTGTSHLKFLVSSESNRRKFLLRMNAWIRENIIRESTEKKGALRDFHVSDVIALAEKGEITRRIVESVLHNVKVANDEELTQFIEDLLRMEASIVGENIRARLRHYRENRSTYSTDNKRALLTEATKNMMSLVTQRSETSEKEEVKSEVALRLSTMPFRIQRPNGSSLHHMIEFLRTTRNGDRLIAEMAPQSFQSFVVEHDWLAAFAGTPEFDGTDIPPLPFEKCCFEFLINGVRVLVFVVQNEDGTIQNFTSVGMRGRWFGNQNQWKDGRLSARAGVMDWISPNDPLNRFVIGQIRAVCIMLDSEVAVREVRRVSEKLNRARVKSGKTPLKDFHVVSLARKHRSERSENSGDGEYTRRRCHWRRGHWRHLSADHKTWVRWALVGDPALGFVEKEYRA